MISPKLFIDTLVAHGVEFYAGVPDSLLKNVCAYITDNLDERHHIIAANEGGAVALAAGYHLATGKVGCVYMQNSGEGNAVNPLASLVDGDVYNIPLLLVIGWRGRPGVHDEPQHVKQGKVTTGLLNVMGINYDVLSKEESTAVKQIDKAVAALRRNEVYALVVEKDTFDGYTLQSNVSDTYSMSREEAIRTVAASIPADAVIVSTTGMISRELFEYRTAMGQNHERDFLTVGSMGHASQIALGIALAQPNRRVYCFDGDGASIMHMGNMAIVGSKAPGNLIHIVFNNGAHDSVGGQPTVGYEIDLVGVARAVRYRNATTVTDKAGLEKALADLDCGPALLEVRVKKGNRKDLGRPTSTPKQNKEALMAFLQK
ncbi:MAG: phosphonopyruvate decarboxylase [Bacteroidales bacterium]|nr:phosphonopyruvate decarboxylase [Bacteroidales bacterium]